jgi:hypothetical protein
VGTYILERLREGKRSWLEGAQEGHREYPGTGRGELGVAARHAFDEGRVVLIDVSGRGDKSMMCEDETATHIWRLWGERKGSSSSMAPVRYGTVTSLILCVG